MYLKKRAAARTTAAAAMAAVLTFGGAASVAAARQKSGGKATAAAKIAAPPISRASLADRAAFTVTQTLAPKGGQPFSRVFKIEVKGSKARADFSDPQNGSVRYLANEKGVFSYLPATNTAVKQTVRGGVEEALRLVFAQAREQMRGAKKVGTATVSGQPTTVYKSANGATIYWGTRPGYKLPVKVVQTNAGGTSTVLVSDIRLGPPLADARFALPAGAQVIDNGGDAPAPSLPGVSP